MPSRIEREHLSARKSRKEKVTHRPATRTAIARTTMQANIRDAWEAADADDITAGGVAYHNYHRSLRRFSEHYEAPFVQTVEAFAMLSPANSLVGNLRSLATLLDARQRGVTDPSTLNVTTMKSFRDKAWGFLTGEMSFHDSVGGPKITAFRHNLLYPWQSDRITIDGHMVATAYGCPKMTMKEANFVLRNHGYDFFENLFLGFARKKKPLVPCQVQAILWYSRKHRFSIRVEQRKDLFDQDPWKEELDPRAFLPYPSPHLGGGNDHGTSQLSA